MKIEIDIFEPIYLETLPIQYDKTKHSFSLPSYITTEKFTSLDSLKYWVYRTYVKEKYTNKFNDEEIRCEVNVAI